MKSPTQQFIQDALKGGWRKTHGYSGNVDVRPYGIALAFEHGVPVPEVVLSAGEILIQPEAWQAVGKTRGWTNIGDRSRTPVDRYEDGFTWLGNWHRFIDHLAEGKTIEQALAAVK